MSLFPDRPERRRIAAFVSATYPRSQEADVYEQLDRLAADLDGECRVFHSEVADPRPLPPDLRARVGTGLFVPQERLVHRNDVEHLRHSLAGRFDALLATLTELGNCSAAAILVRVEMQAACSTVRWLRAWAPELVVSHGLEQGALQALLASHLLDLPWLLTLPTTAGAPEYASMLPLYVHQAALVAVGSQAVYEHVLASCGETARAKLVLSPDGTALPATPLGRLRERLDRERSPGMAELGPDAAFRSRRAQLPAPAPSAAPAGDVTPALLLGAERTGSNLLVGMLESTRSVRCATEVFNPRLIQAGELPWLDQLPWPDRATGDELRRLRLADPAGLHRRMLADGRTLGAKVVGFKLLYIHALVDDRLMDHLAGLDDLRIVHLLRRDRLRRFLSLVRARASDDWFAAAGSAATPPARRDAITLDPTETVMDFELTELFEERYRAIFRRHRGLELDYEDLANHRTEATERLEQLFGCRLGAMQARTRKTGERDLGQAIANLDEIRSALAGTRWQALVPGQSTQP